MYLSEYQTFQSKHQLNEAIRDHLAMHRYNLTETVRKVLTVISRYAVKFPGVAHLKAATIAESIGMSEKTVRRAVNHLQDLRIVRKVVANRKVSGGQGANIMQILPYVQAQVSKREEVAKPVIPSVQPSENSSEPYYSLKHNNNTKERTEARKPAWIPAEFYNLLDAHINSNEIEEYWRSVHATTYRMDLAIEDRVAIGIEAFTAMKAKRKQLRKPIAYFTGAIKRMGRKRYVTGLFNAVFDC